MRMISENRAFGGVQGVYAHPAQTTGCEMTFGLYLPPAAQRGPVPLLWYLSGLTCTHENVMVKAGAQAFAAQHGLALVFPDTSPRGEGVPDDEAYNLGQGAGFYVNATQAPWSEHFCMWDYVSEELPRVLFNSFPLTEDRQAVTGHSMGGHGALTLALRHPGRFASVSAFAPIAHPSASDWALKALDAYLGAGSAEILRHDATHLLREGRFDGPMLIDQGTADPFIDALMPEALASAMGQVRQPGALRLQAGYDHSYFFVSSFIADHIALHAEALGARG